MVSPSRMIGRTFSSALPVYFPVCQRARPFCSLASVAPCRIYSSRRNQRLSRSRTPTNFDHSSFLPSRFTCDCTGGPELFG